MKKNVAILIAGPTAVGKSSVAMKVAKKLNGEIINTDSMQVYKGLEILTAAPSEKDKIRIPHDLYGFLGPNAEFSVAEWLELAKRSARRSWEEGRVPVFAGGTGLYFKALLKGLAPIPDVPDRIRKKYRKKLEKEGSEALYQVLREKDPALAKRLKPGDRQRILRGLEVFVATGKSLTQWQEEPQEGFLKEDRALRVCLTLDREVLRERIRLRFENMVEKGALDEIRDLLKQKPSPDALPKKALGVPPLIKYLQGPSTREAAIERAVIESRQYAKRQMTWFRNQFQDWHFIEADGKPAKKIVELAGKEFKGGD